MVSVRGLIFLVLLLFGRVVFAEDAVALNELSIEQLLDVEVTSVAKKTQRLAVTPAAVYVITADQIKQSGVTHVADALRLAPGISVGRIGANRWAVTSRGFGGRFSNKLLVLVDGRSVYSSVFAGVYWESINAPLEEIERIEVIRGSGSSMWRGNAVNGTINIITKHSSESLGGRSTITAGTGEKGVYFRQGHQLTGYESGYSRYYIQAKETDEFGLVSGGSAGDDWRALEAGFRLDMGGVDASPDISLQGGVSRYDARQKLKLGNFNEAPFISDNIETKAVFLLGKVTRRTDQGVHSSLKFYYDFQGRDEVVGSDRNHTLDVEYLENISFGASHDVVWGLGYSAVLNNLSGSQAQHFNPERRSLSFGSFFLQDEITLLEDELWFTVGSKLDHNPYTGLEFQPTMRVLWAVKPGHKVWGAVSRAVRIPSRLERDGKVWSHLGVIDGAPLPLSIELQGSRDFESEELVATELGYRYRPRPNMYFDLALFYSQYKKLRGFRRQASVVGSGQITQKAVAQNSVNQDVYGAELSAILELTQKTSLELSYAGFYTARANVDSTNVIMEYEDRDSEEFSIRVKTGLSEVLSAHTWLTYNSNLLMNNARATSYLYSRDDYFDLHAGLVWKPKPGVELSFDARNLGNGGGVEYIQEAYTGFAKVPSTFTFSVRFDF